jgi:hypothetical protein
VVHRSISSKSSALPGIPSGRAGAQGRLCRSLRRHTDVHPVRASARPLFAVVLALALASGTFASTNSTATTKIKADWTAFFAGSTSVKQKITLLQNGQSFAAIIKGQASSLMAKSVAAKVSAVTVTSATKAKVHYSLTLGGMPALANQTGVAVLQGGIWKVGDQSFCGLLALEQVKTPACKGA